MSLLLALQGAQPVTLQRDLSAPIDWRSSQTIERLWTMPVERTQVLHRVMSLPVESLQSIRRLASLPVEWLAKVQRVFGLPVEWRTVILRLLTFPYESTMTVERRATMPAEWLAELERAYTLPVEWRMELARLGTLPVEWHGDIARLFTAPVEDVQAIARLFGIPMDTSPFVTIRRLFELPVDITSLIVKRSTTNPFTAWFQGSPVIQIDHGGDFSKWFQGSPYLTLPLRLGIQRHFATPVEFGQLLQRAHSLPVEFLQDVTRLMDIPVEWFSAAITRDYGVPVEWQPVAVTLIARNFDVPVEWQSQGADAWGLSGGGAPVWWYPTIYDKVHEKPAILIWDPDIDRYPRAPRRKRTEDSRFGGTEPKRPSLPLKWIRKWQAPGHPLQVRTAATPPEYWTEELRSAPLVSAAFRPLSYRTVPRTRGGLRTVPLPEVVETRRRRLLDRRNLEAVLLLLLEDC